MFLGVSIFGDAMTADVPRPLAGLWRMTRHVSKDHIFPHFSRNDIPHHTLNAGAKPCPGQKYGTLWIELEEKTK
eukprot:scaffold6688_cov181-Amphora_coffeaeformis.AAC.7